MGSKHFHWIQLQAYATVAALFLFPLRNFMGFWVVPAKMMTSPTGLVLLLSNLPTSLVWWQQIAPG